MSEDNTNIVNALPHSKSILELDYNEARKFFLKHDSYCSLDIPSYICFDKMIGAVNGVLEGKSFAELIDKPRDYDDLNYTIFNNKDGKYSWRPFQLIHPAIYVSLVHHLTENQNWELVLKRFKCFSNNSRLQCFSLPIISLSKETDKAEQVSNWCRNIELRSIELSMEFAYLIQTDITDCYGAIYTHTIAWAIHTKPEAKKRRKKTDLLGNSIDNYIQDMRHGQTNGIPQGSVLMDFIAELVLGLADIELTQKIQEANINEYHILRYRDDYRIFVNNPQDGELIIKLLTEVTIGLGLKLNPTKTTASSEVVRASIKADKLDWICRKKSEKTLLKHLFIIHDHAARFSNSGSLMIALNNFYKRLCGLKKPVKEIMPLIAIIVDIAYRNPRTYQISAAILSKLLSFLGSDKEKLDIVGKINARFTKIPNTGHMQIWLQRVTFPISSNISYDEPICKLVCNEPIELWNNKWIKYKKLKNTIDVSMVIDRQKLSALESVIPIDEVELFLSKNLGSYPY